MALFAKLPPEAQTTGIEFLEFLAAKYENPEYSEGGNQSNEIPAEPLQIPRPDDESVVAAIKRLHATYPMLDKKSLLNPVSNLMTSHLMKGENAKSVIDRLETVFSELYEKQRPRP